MKLYAVDLEKSVTRYVLAKDLMDAADAISRSFPHATIKSVVQLDADVCCSRAALAEFKEMAREVVP